MIVVQLRKRPVLLVVRDGWGHNPFPAWDHANAIHLAHTPVDEALRTRYPTTLIHTSGESVGLPAGVMGNSEVGHQNLGAGRVVDQEVMRITRTIRDGSFFERPVLLAAFEHARRTGGSFHLLGLCSDGRVHSDLEHAIAVVELAARLGFPAERFFVHAITDGRDTAPTSALAFLERLEEALAARRMGRIASVVGRYWAMDRDHRWDRVERAFRLLTAGAERTARSAREALTSYYEAPSESSRRGDEFVLPTSIVPDGDLDPAQRVRSSDAVLFFNYRGDRPRELCKAFVLDDGAWAEVQGGGFERGERLTSVYFAGMTRYERGLPIEVVFDKPPSMSGIFGAHVSDAGLRQFRCAETEKYAHVTFFFNDYREEPFPGEDRQIVPSPRDVSTYDQKPEMSALEVTEEVLARLASRRYDAMVINYANGDMVGHTGSLEAAIQAVETVDACVGRLVEAVRELGGALLVTADHGNCEQMIDPETGGPHTAHTTYDVDLVVVDDDLLGTRLHEGGRLADLAPTILALLGLAPPPEMTGRSLVPGL